MTKKVALLLIVALMAMPITVSAQNGWTVTSVDLKQMSIYNVILNGVDYNDTAKILRVSMTPKVNPWNYGLGLVILKFNATTAPTGFTAYVMLPDNTTVPAVTLLKNFTIENGQYLHHSGWIQDVKYVSIYFYQFINHSTGVETPFWTAFSAGWNDSAHASQWPNYDPNLPYWDKFNRTYPTTPPMALAQDMALSQNYDDYRIVVDAQFPGGNENGGITWIYGLIGGILTGFAVLVVYWCYQKR